MFNHSSSRVFFLISIFISLVVAACGSPSTSSDNTIEWVRFKGRGVSLDMPGTFTAIGLSPETRATIVERLKEKGESYAQFTATLERNPNIYRLILVDVKAATYVGVAGEKAEVKPRTALEDSTWKLPEEITVESLDDVFVGERSAARMITKWTQSNLTQVTYAMKYIDMLFLITYTTQSDKFKEMLPLFEQSIQTFAIEP